jgi:hypothetical protein
MTPMRHATFKPLRVGAFVAARGGILTIAIETIMIG